jgi:hypothetical protein
LLEAKVLVHWSGDPENTLMGRLACGQVETYADDIARISETSPDLAVELTGFTGVAQVVDWMCQRGDGKNAIDMIAMDEFEYDFLVQTEPNGLWLAFGVT